MKRLFFFLLSMAFPWLVLLIKDNPGGAVMALIMQASIIGWIPASMWAMRVLKESEKKPASAR
ncbi:hypothetical protein [Legionella erythra]|uniref:Proteolipid membrane potential modulator n=1 Tax=Legionella erythra TaxID=448 RepID=A0A0W0TT70_LEGER|nr:hypothetical protein [Legionella erythra]KTC98670.1 hypothetical protein Lery_0834 [Legionella erythra]